MGGVETPVIPGEPDVLDVNVDLQGLAADARRRVRRVRRVAWWFVYGSYRYRSIRATSSML
jgi:hypothetical protein